MFIQKASSLQGAFDEALNRARASGVARPRVLVLSDGCVTVPETAQG